MRNQVVLGLLGIVGILMMLTVAVVNSYIAFFVKGEYTGGMLAASAFWVLIGWAFLHASVSES